MSPEVALIVPVLNEARLAPELPLALARFTEAAEVVVVDGGSTDGSREALLAAGMRVIDAERGRARQMNAGARASTAPILLFLHADTRLPPDGPARAAHAVQGGADFGCFTLRIASGDPRLRLAQAIINLRSRLLPSASGDQAIFVTRAAFERAGGFRELALCEDLDLVSRLARAGRFRLIDAEVETSARRWERHGAARTIALMWALRLGYHLGIDPSVLARFYGDAR